MSTAHRRKQIRAKEKQKLVSPCLQFQCLIKVGSIVQTITITEKFTTNYLMKNSPTIQLTQDYEIPLPFLIMNWEEVFEEELSSAMCALANEEQGGFILIAMKHNGMTIQQGISNFFKEDEQKMHDLVKKAMKPIVPQQNIQVKVDGMTLYPDDDTFLTGKSQEFVIKISVCRRIKQKSFFYIEHKLQNFKPNHEFPVIRKKKQGSEEIFNVQMIMENDIYDLMREIAKKASNAKASIWKTSWTNSSLSFNLQAFVKKIFKKMYKNLFRLVEDPTNIFTILQGLETFYRKQMQSFEIGNKFPTIQLQVSARQNLQTSLEIIEEYLVNSQTQYKIIIPLRGFQDYFIEFQIEKGFEAYLVCYLLVQESYLNFSSSIRNKMGPEFEKRFLMSQVKRKFTLGVPLKHYEEQIMRNLLYRYFCCCIPVIRKSHQNNPNLHEFQFKNSDLSAAVFANFIFTLSHKRPL